MDGKSAGLRLHGYLSDILVEHKRTHPSACCQLAFSLLLSSRSWLRLKVRDESTNL